MLPIIENEIVDIYRKLSDGNLTPPQVTAVRERLYAIHHLGRAAEDSWPVKTCSCGRQYTAVEWLQLPLVGYQTSEMLGGEMRNCPCGSTIFMMCRRHAFSIPKARILDNSIVSTSLITETRPPFTLPECMNITIAHQNAVFDMYFDRWDERQLFEAALFSKAPEWNLGENGKLIPVYE